METKDFMLFGLVGGAAYFAYKFYAGSGGYKDQQDCAAAHQGPITETEAASIAAATLTAAAAANLSTDDFIAKQGFAPATAACYRVAVAKYPTQAALTAAGYKTPTSTAPIPGPVAAPASALDGYYKALLARVGAAADPAFTGAGDGYSANLWVWKWYVNQLSLPASVGADPVEAAFAGQDFSQTVTAAQLWATLGAYLRNKGLSGLGYYADLGSLAMFSRAIQ